VGATGREFGQASDFEVEMSEFLTRFFDTFVYLVEAYLNKKVGIAALFSLMIAFIPDIVSNLSNLTNKEICHFETVKK
jgi:hypothetical protein